MLYYKLYIILYMYIYCLSVFPQCVRVLNTNVEH